MRSMGDRGGLRRPALWKGLDPKLCPLLDMLRAAEGRIRMHMPGHKGRALFADSVYALDTTELPCTDDLFAPERGIAQAEALAARSAGAEATLLLSGGGTGGVLAMVLTAVRPGGTLIVPRDCHHSVLSACVWGDIQPVFVPLRHHARSGLLYVDAGDVERAIAAHPSADAVLLTRPDYRALCADLARICATARAAGMAVLADEAHGAHLSWPAPGQPESAGALGAGMWVQSAHKTLPALTGGAWLHLRDGAQAERARAMLRMVHTSSPSFPILASLDGARAWMDAHGAEALVALRGRTATFWRTLREGGSALQNAHALLDDLDGVDADAARVVVDAWPHGYTGRQVSDWMSGRGIDAEMADERHVTLIPTVCDPPGALDRVAEALLALPALPTKQPLLMAGCAAPPLPAAKMRVREAALAPDEWVPLTRAEGRVSARCAGAYPPGVPMIAPGELVTAEVVETLSQALHRAGQCFGVENGGLRCVIA